MVGLQVSRNKAYFNVPDVVKHGDKVYSKHYENVYSKMFDIVDGDHKSETHQGIYKKKYHHFFYHKGIGNKNLFNKKFNLDVTSIFIYGFSKITSLPSNLKILSVIDRKSVKLNLRTIPKSIVSLTFYTYPLDGKDISSLVNLKILNAHKASTIQKLPKNIEYLDFSYEDFSKLDIKNFKLSDYPKLKYLNVSGRDVKIPKEWKEAKKFGKINIKYGKLL